MGLRYDTVMFDFDGTVIDSGPGILRCARETIDELGLPMPEEKVLRKLIGPPLKLMFQEIFGLTPDEAEDVVCLYRKKHKETRAILEGEFYDGIEQLLKDLNAAGAVCAVASAKREATVKETLDHFDMMKYFKEVSGAAPDTEYADKTLIMQDCIERLGVDMEGLVMVGDTVYDAEAAENLDVDFCAAMWGYGFDNKDDIKKHKCRFVAYDVPALGRFLLSG